MTRHRKILSFTVLTLLFVPAAWLIYHETRVPQNEADVLKRQVELQREHRYDKAIQMLRDWMANPSYDSSQDYYYFEQLAMIYFMKAYERPRDRDESILASAANLRKAAEAFDKKKPDGVRLDLYEIGRTYEELGNLAGTNKCQYYENARGFYIRQLPMIEGESYTAYGHTTSLAPVRAEITKHLEATKLKLTRTGCTPESDKQ